MPKVRLNRDFWDGMDYHRKGAEISVAESLVAQDEKRNPNGKKDEGGRPRTPLFTRLEPKPKAAAPRPVAPAPAPAAAAKPVA